MIVKKTSSPIWAVYEVFKFVEKPYRQNFVDEFRQEIEKDYDIIVFGSDCV